MITRRDILNSPPNHVFVFGDNLARTGYGGQAAVARQFVASGKAFGIPTKRKPSADEDAYFSDRADEICALVMAFAKLKSLVQDGKYLVFFPGIGEGYARLKEKSPRAYKMLVNSIYGLCGPGMGEVRHG